MRDDIDVYWADNDEPDYKGSIMKVPAVGGTPTVLVTDQDLQVAPASATRCRKRIP